MSAHVRITTDVVSPALAKAAAALDDSGMTAMLADIGEYLLRSTRERGAREISPDGTAWQALSPRYKAQKDKRRPGLPMLKYDNHMLGDRLSYQVEGAALLLGTSAPYGARMHFGGEFESEARTSAVFFKRERDGTVGSRFTRRSRSDFEQSVLIPAYKVSTPARPWLGMSPADEQEALAIAEDHIAGQSGPAA